MRGTLQYYRNKLYTLMVILLLFGGMPGEVMAQATNIFTWAELNAMRTNLSGDFVLANDLGPGTAGYDTYAAAGANGGAGWLPVGTPEAPFTGTFDGNGHTISGLVINRPEADAAGFFGALGTGAKVENLTLNEFSITARDMTAALAGRVQGATIRDILVHDASLTTRHLSGALAGLVLDATIQGVRITSTDDPAGETGSFTFITAETHAGGLLGRATNGTLTDISVHARIKADHRAGGLAGHLNGTASLQRAAVSGWVNAGSATATGDIGGLAGLLSGIAMVSDAYSVAHVTGPTNAGLARSDEGTGGLIGRIQGEDIFVVNTYAATATLTSVGPLGGLVGRNSAFTGATIPFTPNPALPPLPATPPNVLDSFWDAELSGQGAPGTTLGSEGGIALTSLRMKVSATFTQTDSGVLDNPWDFTNVWTIQGPAEAETSVSYPYLRSTAGLTHTAAPAPGREPGNMTFPFDGGDGSNERPFQIANWTQLSALQQHRFDRFILVADLTNATSDYTARASATANDNAGWQPVGTTAAPFSGHLDGNGRTITHAVINRSDEDDTGLFGVIERSLYLDTGLKNITKRESLLSGRQNTGALVGRSFGLSQDGEYYPVLLNDITLDDITITGTTGVGGLAGSALFTDMSSITAKDIAITGVLQVGGLAGVQIGGSMRFSTASGALAGTNLTEAGGLAGRLRGTGLIEQSYADVGVDGSLGAGDIGGLVGRASELSRIRDTYALGTLQGPASGATSVPTRATGGLVGRIDDARVTVARSYAAQFQPEAFENLGGLIGMNAYTGGSTFNGANVPPFPGDVPNVLDSFWDAERSSIGELDETTGSAGGTGRSTLRLKFKNTFQSTDQAGLDNPWDFTTVWNILEFNEAEEAFFVSYPYLRSLEPAAENEPGREPYFFAGGFGTEEEPFLVTNWRNLHFLREFPLSRFELLENLNASSNFYTEFASATANSGRGWEPIGTASEPFKGQFDGKEKTISDYVIGRPAEDEIGLFGALRAGDGPATVIRDLTISNVTVTGRYHTGALVGRLLATQANPATISGITLSDATVTGEWNVGGLAGSTGWTHLEDLFVQEGGDPSKTVVIRAEQVAGGIAGEIVSGSIRRSRADVRLEGRDAGNDLTRAGGIAGRIGGTALAEELVAEAELVATGGWGDIGGLAGLIDGQAVLRNAYSLSEVYGPLAATARNNLGTGGLVGRVQSTDNLIQNTYAANTVLTASINLGGLVGINTELASLGYNPTLPGTPPFPVTLSNVFNSFWDVRLSGLGAENERSASFGGMGKSTFVMKTLSMYIDTDEPGLELAWDMGLSDAGGTVWRILTREKDENFISYPYLRSVLPASGSEPGRVAFPFAGGFGTSAAPFEIELWQHMWNVRLFPDLFYIVTEDLSPSTADYAGLASATANDNTGWFPVGTLEDPFRGTLDGDGHTISGFVVNRPGQDYTGLFGYIAGTPERRAEIRDLTLDAFTVTGRDYVGGLSGYALRATFHRTGAGTRSGTPTPATQIVRGRQFTGGLFGVLTGVDLTESYALATVSAAGGTGEQLRDAGILVGHVTGSGALQRVFSRGSIVADGGAGFNGNIGGLVGRLSQAASITNAYTFSAVTGPEAGLPTSGTGGLVGRVDNASARIASVFAVNTTLAGDTNRGGLIGVNVADEGGVSPGVGVPPYPHARENIFNGFWDVDTSGLGAADTGAGSAGGTGKTSRQLINAPTFAIPASSEGLEAPGFAFECFTTPPVWGISVAEDAAGFTAVNQGYPHLKWEGHDPSVVVNVDGTCYTSLDEALVAVGAGTHTEIVTVQVNIDQKFTDGATFTPVLSGAGAGPANYDLLTLSLLPRRSLTVDDGGTFRLEADQALLMREQLVLDGIGSRLELLTGSALARDEDFPASAIVRNDAAVEVHKDVVLDVTSFFSSLSTTAGGELHLRSGALYRNTGNDPVQLRVERTLGKAGQPALSQFGWRMVASPVATTYAQLFNSVVTQGYPGSDFPNQSVFSPNVIWYDEQDGGTAFQSWRRPVSASTSIPVGRGYFYYNFDGNARPDDETEFYEDALPRALQATGLEPVISSEDGLALPVTFTARKATVEDPTVAHVYINYSEAQSGWNLVGNPTASVLRWGDISDAGWTKTRMNNTIYVWDPAMNDFLVYNGSGGTSFDGFIAPYQAFWVQANAPEDGDSPALLVKNEAKVIMGGDGFVGGDDLLLSRTRNRRAPETLTFTVRAGEMVTQNWISFSDEGLNSLDAYDAFRLEPMSNTWISAATSMRIGEPTLVINSLPRELEEALALPFYVGAAVKGEPYAGDFQLEWEFPDNWTNRYQVLLMDHDLKQSIPLTSRSTYQVFHDTRSQMRTQPLSDTGMLNGQDPVAARDRRCLPDEEGCEAPDRPAIVVGLPGNMLSNMPVTTSSTDTTESGSYGSNSDDSGPASNYLNLSGDITTDRPRFSIVIQPLGESERYIPLQPKLFQNYPNPFNPSTTIRFTLPERMHARIQIFDMLGRPVSDSGLREYAAGTHDITWDARALSSGVYVYQLTTTDYTLTRKMTFLK